MLLQRSQSLIQFVRTYCLNDVQAQIISAICRNFDFVDARNSCENGAYDIVKWAAPCGENKFYALAETDLKHQYLV